MADPRLQVVVDLKDKASKQLDGFNKNLDKTKNTVKTVGLAMAAFGAAAAFAMKSVIDASNELNNSLIGLNSVANAFGQSADDAKNAALDLAKDGLLSVKDAANSLKNLLATGFSLPEAINLMNAFKDSAAFNRQGTLAFGQAIEGATQGIKNQNSILVDNAGITKNLSLILKEAGYSMQDLSRVSNDVNVRAALYNGLLKEASVFQGDAARLADTLAGKQAALATAFFMVKAQIGELVSPFMGQLVDATSRVLEQVNIFIITVSEAGGIVEYFTEKVRQLLDYIEEKSGFITIFNESWNRVVETFNAKLSPALARLWEAVKPLAPFFEQFAKVIGVILYGALIAIVKFIENTVIPIIHAMTIVVEGAINVVNAFRSAWDSVTTVLSKVITLIEKAIQKARELASLGGGGIGGFFSSVFGGFRADGGPVSAGKSYVVGERGPELFTPSVSGNITPNGSGASVNVYVTVEGNVTTEQDLAESVGNMLTQQLKLSSAIV